MLQHAPESRASFLSTLGWALYLACSWTWVIGMYLPVLLVRDFGFAGWIAFAVPNVVGAAALGWIIRSREQASALLERHAAAVTLFSAVTVGFQVYALLWLLPLMVGMAGAVLVALVLACALFAGVAQSLATRLNAAAVWAFSMAVFVMLGLSGVLEMPPADGRMPAVGLSGLIPACLLGFLLCPYLDVTFLSARARMQPRAARVAFTLGFAVFFLAMIVFALLYALPVLDLRLRGTLAWLLAGHFTIQVAFTIAAHTAVTRPIPASILAIVLASVLGVVALAGEIGGYEPFGIGLGELVYRCFMGFYGLLFPAYVLVVMVAGASWRMYWATCLLAVPFFVVGFVGGWMPWTAGGVAAVALGAALAAGLKRRGGRA